MPKLIKNWEIFAVCAGGDPDAFFTETVDEQNLAKRICLRCSVRYECLAKALDNRIEHGVWGGMNERERRDLLRRYPYVPSWRRLFEMAMNRGVANIGATAVFAETAGRVPAKKSAPVPGHSTASTQEPILNLVESNVLMRTPDVDA